MRIKEDIVKDVIPAKAGIQNIDWTPASAGVTCWGGGGA